MVPPTVGPDASTDGTARTHKVELLAILGHGGGPGVAPIPEVEIEINTPIPEVEPWWQAHEDYQRERFQRARKVADDARRLRAANGLPPWGAKAEPKPPAPGELRCGRCGGAKVVEATTHGGQTIRGDCARCGRFIAFMVWYGRLLHPSRN